MHYEKPMVMELNARARVTGQTPNACISGLAATGNETCVDGPVAGYTCATGDQGAFGATCVVGNLPGDGYEDCVDGSSAFYCVPGVGGQLDPEGCRTGPLPFPF